jgi:S1-C subfamily serine protease
MKNITIKSLREKQKDAAEITEDFFSKPKNKTKELEEEQYKPKKIRAIINFIATIFFVLTIGGVGGILIDRFALPYLFVKYPELNQYEFLSAVNERTTVVEVIKEIRISDEKAVVEAIKKARPSIVEIAEISDENTDPIYKNSGIILTNDGLIIASAKNITSEKNIQVKLHNGEIYPAKLVYEDELNKLAIIKIDQANLPVVTFANSDNLELGEKLIIFNSSVVTDIVSKLIDDYVVLVENNENEDEDEDEITTEPITQKRIKIINVLGDSFDKAPAINLKGEIVGFSQTGDLLIPINEVEKFIDDIL